jgi:hypothetical protein
MAPVDRDHPRFAPGRQRQESGSSLTVQIIAACALGKHMAIVGYLKHGMGTGTPTR